MSDEAKGVGAKGALFRGGLVFKAHSLLYQHDVQRGGQGRGRKRELRGSEEGTNPSAPVSMGGGVIMGEDVESVSRKDGSVSRKGESVPVKEETVSTHLLVMRRVGSTCALLTITGEDIEEGPINRQVMSAICWS